MDINPEEESLLGHSPPRRTKGGLKTMPFIIGKQAHVILELHLSLLD